MSKYGIDVSSYNGAIDWAKVKAAGCAHAVLKICRKELTVDKQFSVNIAGCKAQGIPYGVYRYTYESTPAQARKAAQAVMALLDKYQAARNTVVWWDVEDASIRSAAKTTLTASILAAQEVVEKAGYGFGVYCGLYWYNSVLDTSGLDCPFWVARYPTRNAVAFGKAPAAKYRPSIRHHLWGWQYSSSGVVPGINHATDLNEVYGPAGSQTNTSTSSKGGFDLSALSTIKNGSRGAQVKSLQALLNGKHKAGLSVDGIAGTKTVAAVKSYQKAHGLSVDGIAGAKTWTSILTT